MYWYMLLKMAFFFNVAYIFLDIREQSHVLKRIIRGYEKKINIVHNTLLCGNIKYSTISKIRRKVTTLI